MPGVLVFIFLKRNFPNSSSCVNCEEDAQKTLGYFLPEKIKFLLRLKRTTFVLQPRNTPFTQILTRLQKAYRDRTYIRLCNWQIWRWKYLNVELSFFLQCMKYGPKIKKTDWKCKLKCYPYRTFWVFSGYNNVIITFCSPSLFSKLLTGTF